MDRAHRLGQRKVVNVHRLIMRGTLEEKVMSLQKFKVSIANAVINADNASMNTMNTDQLLDLFTSAEGKKVFFQFTFDFSFGIFTFYFCNLIISQTITDYELLHLIPVTFRHFQCTNIVYIYVLQGTRKSIRSDENSEGNKKLPGGGKGLKAILGGLEELWDQPQYTKVHDLYQFLVKLNA